MSRRVGLELTGDRVRAVTVSRWLSAPFESFELRWDPTAPADGVAILRQHLGNISGIALSVGIEFLHVKHVKLPPVSTMERRNILTLEPDRFFPIESGEVVVSVSGGSDIVFAADARLVESWVTAFERWAPVDTVEASPVSLARALRRGGVRDGTFQLPAAADERATAELRGGALVSARRIGSGPAEGQQQNPPAIRGVAPEFASAFGAVLGADDSPDQMLVSNSGHARISRRRMAGVTRGALNFALAVAFVLAALDRSRSRQLAAVEQEIAMVTPRAAKGASLQTRLASLNVELAATRSVTAARVSPVIVLAALSRRLPAGATVMSVRADGLVWQIEGTARDAGALIPALAADKIFEDVRFLSASSRFREGNRSYETFSIALRAVP